MRILAIDPGREKCGLAIGEGGQLIKRAVVSSSEVIETIRAWVAEYSPQRILIGNRTGAKGLQQRLGTDVKGLPIVLVEEGGTTLEARRRYFQGHPPRGWRRLLPVSMQRPPEPYDDYVAALLLERYGAG
jgi:RNase H-fold protein (predicted Holliday junction resolvase)